MIISLPEFILASISSIRRKVLDQAGLQYKCIKPIAEEPRANGYSSPELYVKICAQQKAKEISLLNNKDIVVGCDQTVYFQSQILNKAANQTECIQRLMAFSGKSHQLINGLSIFQNGEEIHYHAESITVNVRKLSHQQITRYVEEEMPLSSVACYYLEGKGIQLIENIEGSFFTALGLPLLALMNFLTDYNKKVCL
jgi:septum formation protein